VPACFDHQRCYSGSNVPPGASLDLSFMTPGVLDPRVTFTRNSAATYFDSSGVMQAARVNLLFPSTNWGTAQPPSTSQDGVVFNVGPSPTGSPDAQAFIPGPWSGVHQTFTFISPGASSTTYTFSVYAKAMPLPYLYMELGNTGFGANAQVGVFNLSTGTIAQQAANASAAIQNIGNGWYRCSIAATTPAGSSPPYVPNIRAGHSIAEISDVWTGNGVDAVWIWGTQAEIGTPVGAYAPTTSAPNGAPRWDYDPVTHALRGLLIEEARTNVTLQSSGANAAWGGTSAALIVTPNAGVAPDGTTTATLCVDTPPVAQHAYGPGASVIAANTVYTCTMFVKPAGRTRVELLMIDSSFTNGIFALFDLAAGTALPVTYVGAGSGGSSSIRPIGNGWYRCSVTGLMDTTSTAMNFLAYLDNGGGNYYPGDGVSGLQIWGAQVEAGAFATSYIPTTAAAVTRAADVCSMPTAAWYQASPYSLMFEVLYPNDGGNGRIIGGIGDSNLADAGYFQGQYWLYGGGTAYSIGLTANAVNKLCGTVNNAALLIQEAVDGQVGPPVAMTATPAPGTTLAFGTPPWALGGSQLGGWLRHARYWPRALTNAELQSVTR
jgi:hypothetical protein